MTNYTVAPIDACHDAAICQIIQTVGAEFGAVGDGFGPSDVEVLNMSRYYSDKNRSRYLIATIADKVVGGGGIAPFNDSKEVCELRKLFLLPQSRGSGLGKTLTLQCLDYAKAQGFKQCYLDTLATMTGAIGLYQKLGFRLLDKPLGGTIHGGCDVWMIKDL